MTTLLKSILILGLISGLAITTVTGLRCYVCNSERDDDCAQAEKLKESHLQTCQVNQGGPFCKKEVHSIGGFASVERICSYFDQAVVGCTKSESTAGKLECYCNTDECNNGRKIIPATGSILLFLVGFMYYLTH